MDIFKIFNFIFGEYHPHVRHRQPEHPPGRKKISRFAQEAAKRANKRLHSDRSKRSEKSKRTGGR